MKPATLYRRDGFDLTVRRNGKEFHFTPHTEKADDFLFAEFGQIGDRNLTMQDADLIIHRALRRGYRLNNLLWCTD